MRALVGGCLVKSLFAPPTLDARHRADRGAPGAACGSRRAPANLGVLRLRERTARAQAAPGRLPRSCRRVASRKIPGLGEDVAIDASDLPAYAKGHPRHTYTHLIEELDPTGP